MTCQLIHKWRNERKYKRERARWNGNSEPHLAGSGACKRGECCLRGLESAKKWEYNIYH